MRRQFRGEFAAELEILEQARNSVPVSERVVPAEPEVVPIAQGPAETSTPPRPPEPPAKSPGQEAVPPADMGGGFWSRVKGRLWR